MRNLSDQDPIWRFLEDDRFIKWMSHPDPETIAYWEKWMETHPESLSALFEARELARDLAFAQKNSDNALIPDEIWVGIRQKIEESALVPHRRTYRIGYRIAASFLGLLIAGAGFLFVRSHRSIAPEVVRTHAPEKILRRWHQNELERVNESAQDQVVYLVDGSKITLRPGARIHHIGFLQKDKRQVWLEGNAFFDVAKDPSRPFYVYSKDLVVRVLGTSFLMTTNRENGDVTVIVRTGKVAVTKKTDSLHPQPPLILTSNQKAWYKAQIRDLVVSVPNHGDLTPEVVIPSFVSFHFEEAPVIGIFQTLEEAYGIPIHYDPKTFSSCVITTSLSDETLEEKIKIVCEAIGAGYRIDSGGIYLEGKPCK